MFENKTAIVTGASRGIGTYIVNELIARGCFVIGIARSEKGLQQVQETYGPDKFNYIVADIGHVTELQNLVKKIQDSGREIHYLVNNAGIELYREYQDFSFSELQRIIHVNLLGPMELTRQLLPALLLKGGHIINIASLAGKKGVAYNTIYSATKAGLILWTDGLRQELAGSNVGITVICPGYIAEAGMFFDGGEAAPALLGTSSPAQVSRAVIEAIERNRAEIIVNNGPIKPLLAIGQLAPKLGDRIVAWFGVKKLSKKRIVESVSGESNRG